MKLKQFTSILLTMILVITLLGVAALTVGAEPAKTPYVTSSLWFYGNGTPLYVVEGTSGGTAVYYMNGTSKVYMNASGAAGDDLSSALILGGPYGYHLDGDTSVTMTGGVVDSIYGAGGGATATDTSLGQITGNATIKITGGSVTTRVGASIQAAIYGNFTLEITGGTVKDVSGAVRQSNYGSSWRKVHGDSTIIISDNATVTGEVFVCDGYNPVSGAATLISSIPLTIADHVPGSFESYVENFLYKTGSTWKVKGNVTLPAGMTLTIASGETLSVPSSATLTNKGTIINNGALNIKGTFNQNGSVTCTSHVYTYECDKTCDFCGATRSASCSSTAASITTTESGLVVRCQHCGERIGSISLMVSDSKYNGQTNAVGIFAGGLSPYDRVYLDATGQELNEIPILPGTYTVRVTYNGASVSKDFTISKGVLKVVAAPSVSYRYGEDPTTKTLTGGKVVIEGGDSTEITGTWAWSGDKAVFTPDAEYDGLFETLGAQEATHNVQLATPLVTITLPSPSAMPGMKVDLGIKVKNPYTDTPEVLPTEFTYKYKINGGTLQTASGSTFIIPSDAALGSTISVYVESVAVEGKYFSGRSGTVEIYLGQVDYSEDIANLEDALAATREDLQDQLDALDGTYATDADVSGKIADIQSQINALDSTYATDTALADAIGNIQYQINELVRTLATKEALELARTDLQNQINALDDTYATDADVSNKIAAIQDQIDALDSTYATDKALEDAVSDIQAQIDNLIATLATKTELETAKQHLQDQIDKLDDTYATDVDVANKIAGIQDQIDKLDDTYATDKALEDAVADIQAQIDNLIATLATKDELADAEAKLNDALAASYEDLLSKINSLDAAVGGIRYVLEKADADNKAELIALIETVEAELAKAIAEVESNLVTAKTELEKAIADGDASLSDKIASLTTALNEAKTALEAADAANKKALEDEMKEGYDALEDALEVLENTLEVTRIRLEAEDSVMKKNAAELAEKVDALETFLIVVCVIAGAALVGCGTLTVWVVINKKKF